MLRHYILISIRNLARHLNFSIINIGGLAIGLASSILILLFIVKELSYDRFHEHRDRIHRLYIDGVIGEQPFSLRKTAGEMVIHPEDPKEYDVLLETTERPIYQRIARKALQLRDLGMSDRRIAGRLAVTDKTIAKAIAWVQNSLAE